MAFENRFNTGGFGQQNTLLTNPFAQKGQESAALASNPTLGRFNVGPGGTSSGFDPNFQAGGFGGGRGRGGANQFSVGQFQSRGFEGPTNAQTQEFTNFLATNPGFEELLRFGTQQSSALRTDLSNEEIPIHLQAQLGGNLTALGMPAQLQQLATLNQILSRQGAIDPAIRAQLENQIARGTQQSGLAFEQFSSRQGLRGPGQGAVAAGIQGSGQNQLQALRFQLASDQENRMRQDLQLANQIAVAPSLALGGNAIQQQQLIDAQQSDPLLQALGVAAGAASNAFAPGTGGAATGITNSLTGANGSGQQFNFDFGFGPGGPTVR